MVVKHPYSRCHQLRVQCCQADNPAGLWVHRIAFHVIRNVTHDKLRHQADAEPFFHKRYGRQIIHDMIIRLNPQRIFFQKILDIGIRAFPLRHKLVLAHFRNIHIRAVTVPAGRFWEARTAAGLYKAAQSGYPSHLIPIKIQDPPSRF